FGTVSGAGKKNRIPGRLRLPRGTHTFWVSFELSPSADLTHQIGVSCLRVSLGKTRIRPEAVGGQQPLRMGAAVRLHGQDGVHTRSEEHTSELQSRENLVCRLLLEKKKRTIA